jgi:hypothetical protein
MSATVKPSFGFSVSDIQPGPPVQGRGLAAVEPEADQAAERLGFKSREAVARRRRRTLSDEPSDQINIRASISDINRFVEWCERNRYSYREGFSHLVQRIE